MVSNPKELMFSKNSGDKFKLLNGEIGFPCNYFFVLYLK